MSREEIRDAGSSPGQGRGVLAVCLFAGALPLADLGVMNVAVPTVALDLGLGPGGVKALIAVYTLTFGVALVPGGRLGDRFGRRRLFRIGLVLFGVAAAAAALAPGIGWLLTARAVQGAAAGLISPQVGGLLQGTFTGERRARAIGALGSSIAVSTAIGPLLGGVLIGVFGGASGDAWRWALGVDLVAFVPLAGSFILPAHTRPANRDLDLVGTAGLALIALCLLLPVVGSRNAGAIGWWTGAVALIVALGFWEARYARSGRLPLLSAALLRNRDWLRGCAVIASFLAASTTLPVLISLQSQSALRLSALQSGLVMVPYAVGSAAGAILGGRWVLRRGQRVPVLGLLLFAGSLLVTLLIGVPDGDRIGPVGAVGWLALLTVIGFGTGMVITPNQTLSYRSVPSAQAGNASGLLLTAQRLGSALGIALATSLFYGTAGIGGAITLLVGFTVGALVLSVAFSLSGPTPGRRP